MSKTQIITAFLRWPNFLPGETHCFRSPKRERKKSDIKKANQEIRKWPAWSNEGIWIAIVPRFQVPGRYLPWKHGLLRLTDWIRVNCGFKKKHVPLRCLIWFLFAKFIHQLKAERFQHPNQHLNGSGGGEYTPALEVVFWEGLLQHGSPENGIKRNRKFLTWKSSTLGPSFNF